TFWRSQTLPSKELLHLYDLEDNWPNAIGILNVQYVALSPNVCQSHHTSWPYRMLNHLGWQGRCDKQIFPQCCIGLRRMVSEISLHHWKPTHLIYFLQGKKA